MGRCLGQRAERVSRLVLDVRRARDANDRALVGERASGWSSIYTGTSQQDLCSADGQTRGWAKRTSECTRIPTRPAPSQPNRGICALSVPRAVRQHRWLAGARIDAWLLTAYHRLARHPPSICIVLDTDMDTGHPSEERRRRGGGEKQTDGSTRRDVYRSRFGFPSKSQN